jgi:hypothetical protein
MNKIDFSEMVVLIECGGVSGSGFYINDSIIMTIGHVIKEYYEPEKHKIYVNSKIEAIPFNSSYEADIVLLKVKKSVKDCAFMPICVDKIDENSVCTLYGYPAATENYITNVQLFSDVQDNRLDEINFKISKDEPIKHFLGTSGSPIINNGFIIAVVKSEIQERAGALRLVGIRIRTIQDVLKSKGVPIAVFGDFLTLKIKNQYEKRFSYIRGVDGRDKSIESFQTRLTVIRDRKEKIENKNIAEIELMKKNRLYMIEISNLFLGAESILITAETGMGKTHICKYIAQLWSKNKLWKDSVRSLIYIPLREMQSRGCKNFSLFVNQYYFHEEYDVKAIEKSLNKNNVMFIFDGYDELNEDYKLILDDLLFDLEYKYKMFTSKPYSIDRLGKIDRHIIINEFNGIQIRSFLQESSNYESVYSYVYKNEWLLSLARTPLYLEIFRALCDKPNFDLNTIKSITKMLQIYLEKIFIDYVIISKKNKIATEKINIFGIFSNIAYLLDENNKTELSGDEVEKCIRKYSQCPDGVFQVKNENWIEKYVLEYLLSCHVFVGQGDSMFFLGNKFHFTHNIFRDYFLGFYLSKMNKEKLFEFVSVNKNLNKYKKTFIFLAGLSSQRSIEVFIRAIRHDAANNNAVFLEMLVVECISQNENEIIDEDSKNIIKNFIQWAVKKENCLALGRLNKQFENTGVEKYIINEISSSLFGQEGKITKISKSLMKFLKIKNIMILKNIVKNIKEDDYFDDNLIYFMKNHCEYEFVFELLLSKINDEDITFLITMVLKEVLILNFSDSKIDILIKQFNESELWYEKSGILQILSVVKRNDRIISLAYQNLENLDDEVQKYCIEYLLDNNNDDNVILEAIEKYIENNKFSFLFKVDLIKRIPNIYDSRRYSQAAIGSYPGNAISSIKHLIKKNLDNENVCIALEAVKALRKMKYSPHNYMYALVKIIWNRLNIIYECNPCKNAIELFISSQNVLEEAFAIMVDIIITDDQEINVAKALLAFAKHECCENIILNELILQKCRVKVVVDYIKKLYISATSVDTKVLTSIFLFDICDDKEYLDTIIDNLLSISIDLTVYKSILLNLVQLIEKNKKVENFFITGIEKSNECIVRVIPVKLKIVIASKLVSINNVEFYIENFSLFELFSIYKESDCIDILLLIKRKIEINFLPYTIGTDFVTTYENSLVRNIKFRDEQLKNIKYLLRNIYVK